MSVAYALERSGHLALGPDCGGNCHPTPYGVVHDMAHHRAVWEAAWEAAHQPVGPAVWGRLTVDREDGTATVDGTLLALSPTEWRLLLVLAEAGGRMVSRDRLAAVLWPEWTPDEGGWHVLRVLASRLRMKLRPHGVGLGTAKALGYRLTEGPGPTGVGALLADGQRERVVTLLRSTDWTLVAIARDVGVTVETVTGIRTVEGIVRDVPRYRSAALAEETRALIERLLLETTRSQRVIAREAGVSRSTVERIWRGLRATSPSAHRTAQWARPRCGTCRKLVAPLRACRSCGRE